MAAKVNVSVKIDPVLKEQLEAIGDREDRTLSNQISSFLKRSVEHYLRDHSLLWIDNQLTYKDFSKPAKPS